MKAPLEQERTGRGASAGKPKPRGLPATGLLSTEDVATVLRLSPATIVWWRSQKQGPAWVRLGKGKRAPIRYRTEAVEAYIAQMETAEF
jgi:hypothetical protein